MIHSHECPHEGGHVWFDPNEACPFKGRDMTCWSYYPDDKKHVPSIGFLRSHQYLVTKHAGAVGREAYSKFEPRS